MTAYAVYCFEYIDDRLMDVFFAGFAKDEVGVEDKEHPVYNCTFVNKPTFGSFDLAEIIYEDDIAAVNKHNYLQGALHCHKKTLLDEIVLCGFCTDICCISCDIIQNHHKNGRRNDYN